MSEIMIKVNELLDESIAADGFQIRSGADGNSVIDLAKIDFDDLAKRFKQSKKKMSILSNSRLLSARNSKR